MNVRRGILSITAALAAAPGCGPPDARFVNSERIDDLHRPVQQAVADALVDHFGTPHELVAWLRLPVNYGGYAGIVSAAPEANRRNTFRVELDPPADELEPGQELVWISGSLLAAPAGEQPVPWTVADYDPETMLITVDAAGVSPDDWPADWQPAPDDAFIVAPGGRLKHGRALYMEHCMHCHGVSGDGNGPTAPYLDPRPRDYRLGLFKFTSTGTGLKASRADLALTIRHGIPGTYMPSFLLLGDDELQAIVEYIRWLAMRGEFEKRMIDELYVDHSQQALEERKRDEAQQRSEGSPPDETVDEAVARYLEEEFPGVVDSLGNDLKDAWEQADLEDSVFKPAQPRLPAEPTPAAQLENALRESRERGLALYYSDKAKCATCHGPQGRGDGSEIFAFRDIPNTNPVQKYAEPGLFDDWGQKIEPRDLTRGVFRGGRRPIDIYRRIAVGIKGTPMPAFASALSEQERWDLVNFVLSVPYRDEPMTPPPQSAAPAPAATTAQIQPSPGAGPSGGPR
ncbi:MAG TPA: cytochrome c [Planctomycetaceae bacterium]|nr:cytochrome c [Planctomycetaceae bacterium]